MKVSFIGSGNVATQLAIACVNNQIQVKDIYSKTYENAEALARKCNANAVHHLTECSDDIDLLIVAVSDNSLQDIRNDLEFFKCPVVHTSGSTSINVLTSEHHHFGVLYPLQTFSINKDISIQKVPFFIEYSDENLRKTLESFCGNLGANSKHINSEQRMNLHIAAVFACNFSNHMYSIAEKLLRNNNIDFDLLKPLILETAHKIEHISPHDAQTGPALRNDSITLEKHLASLSSEKQIYELYKAISEDIIKSQKNKTISIICSYLESF